MVQAFVLMMLGIAFVTFGANYMVDGASTIAKKLQISDLIIGLTIVSFGTSAPELMVSVVAATSGNTDVAVGNVIGSNLLNIWIILGVTGLIVPLQLQSSTIYKEIPFSLLGILAAFVLINDAWIDGTATSQISRIDGIILLLFFAIYLYYMFTSAMNDKTEPLDEQIIQRPLWLSIIFVVGGIIGLTLGGSMIVDNAVFIARSFGVSDAIIGLTLVSIGTSIPELATSVAAALKRNSDIAVGNVVGSNIFNTFLILGISSTIAPLPLAGVSNIDFGVCIFATLGLFVSAFALKRMEIYRFEAAAFLLFYTLYLVYLFNSLGIF